MEVDLRYNGLHGRIEDFTIWKIIENGDIRFQAI